MRRGSHHTPKTKKRLGVIMRNEHTRRRISEALLHHFEVKREQVHEPNFRRHEEPPLTEEVMAAQDRLLARFGRHTGRRVDHGPAHSDLTEYGMETCHACGQLTAVEFPCTKCNAERPFVDQRNVA